MARYQVYRDGELVVDAKSVQPDEPLSLVDRAALIAMQGHAGQKDKQGHPYILHVARVAGAQKNVRAQALGWLHDVLEDVPDGHLRMGSMPQHIRNGVLTLSRMKESGEPYDEYIKRIVEAGDADALQVKAADLLDNLRRGAYDKRFTDLCNRYRMTLSWLREKTDVFDWRPDLLDEWERI